MAKHRLSLYNPRKLGIPARNNEPPPGQVGVTSEICATKTLTVILALILAAVVYVRREALSPENVMSALRAKGLKNELLDKNAGRPGDPDLVEEYRRLNAKYFQGGLPDIPVNWEPDIERAPLRAPKGYRLDGLWAGTGQEARIFLHPALKENPRERTRTLCHEMAHEYLSSIGDAKTHHGPAFQKTLRRLADEGAFEGVFASESEKEALRAQLEHERGNLADFEMGIESARALTDAPGPDQAARVESFNGRVRDYNLRLDGLKELAARYNMMITFPDGDGENFAFEPKR